jgi:hypothetical protein
MADTDIGGYGMSTRTKWTIAVVLALAGVLILGVICSALPGNRWQPSVEQEQPDGDCDAGDLRESKPDPDCNGLWFGTPTPASSKKATPAASRRTPAPRKTR